MISKMKWNYFIIVNQLEQELRNIHRKKIPDLKKVHNKYKDFLEKIIKQYGFNDNQFCFFNIYEYAKDENGDIYGKDIKTYSCLQPNEKWNEKVFSIWKGQDNFKELLQYVSSLRGIIIEPKMEIPFIMYSENIRIKKDDKELLEKFAIPFTIPKEIIGCTNRNKDIKDIKAIISHIQECSIKKDKKDGGVGVIERFKEINNNLKIPGIKGIKFDKREDILKKFLNYFCWTSLAKPTPNVIVHINIATFPDAGPLGIVLGLNIEKFTRKTIDFLWKIRNASLIGLKIRVEREVIARKKEMLSYALRSAVAAIMARNMSHNIGSHVLNYLSNPEEVDNLWII